jgi:hypothetical protein
MRCLCLLLQLLQLEKRIDQDIIVARTLIAQKKKDRALLALKKKKLSENQLQSIQAYLMNVEDMVSSTSLLSCYHFIITGGLIQLELSMCRVARRDSSGRTVDDSSSSSSTSFT